MTDQVPRLAEFMVAHPEIRIIRPTQQDPMWRAFDKQGNQITCNLSLERFIDRLEAES